MNEELEMIKQSNRFDPGQYQIKVKGRLSGQWSEWFDGLEISYEDGLTTIAGSVVDQSALHGLLNRIRDLGLQLVSVHRIDSDLTK